MNIRPFDRSDIDDVMTIERQSYPIPMRPEDFLHAHTYGCLCLVAESNGLVIGYLIYSLKPNSREILSIGVLQDARHSGVGRALVKHVQDGALTNGINEISLIALHRSHIDGFLTRCGLRRVGSPWNVASRWSWKPLSECGDESAIESDRLEE